MALTVTESRSSTRVSTRGQSDSRTRGRWLSRRRLFQRDDIYAELGEVIIGKAKGRESPKEPTVFDSSGLGIQDVAAASIVYERAKKSGKGQWVKFL